jgi:hypothetical protein
MNATERLNEITAEREKMIYVICNWYSCHKGITNREFDRMEQKLMNTSYKELKRKYGGLNK